MSTEKSVFETLVAVDITGKLKQKNGLDYLPWSSAWEIIKLHYPKAFYDVVKDENGCLYHTDGRTAWVEVSITICDEKQTETLAVMNHRNQAIPLDQITSVDVNKSVKRALTKCCALFGLGLSLWNGEELSDTAKEKKTKEARKVEKEKSELAELNRQVTQLAKEKIEAGVDREVIYSIITKYADGKRNPNAITDIEDSKACFEEIAQLEK